MPGRKYTSGSSYRYGFNGQEKDDEISGAGNHNTAMFWEYDTRLVRRWNIDPVVKENESPYLCFSGNPILISDPNGDDGGTAAAIFIATQEVSAVAAATGVGAVAVPFIELAGTIWGLYELMKDAPIPATPKAAVVKTPVAQPKVQVHTADKVKDKAETNTASPKVEVKSRSEGAKDGSRAGKPITKKGKEEVWQENTQKNNGKPKCEGCDKDLKKPSQSKKGESTPDDAGQVDHIYPQSKNGDGTSENGQLLCPTCNGSGGKGSDLPVPK